MPTPAQIKKAINTIRSAAKTFGIQDAFFVGGYPRSIAMGFGLKDVHDLDMATGTPDKAIQLAGFVAERRKIPKYEILHRSNTVRLELGGVEVDFQGPSAHEHSMPYLHELGIEATPVSLNIFDRDFTINSLAMPILGNHILDITERGRRDIEDKRIVTIIPAEDVIPRNPLMITRAIKFAYKYGFSIDGNLWKAMVDFAHVLPKSLSKERLAIEAYTLSQYDAADTLKELGLEWMTNLAKEFDANG